MEIILWIIGIVLGLLLLKFIYCLILQLIAPGLGLGFLSFIICAALMFFDVIEWKTCCVVVEWAFYIGTGIGVLLFVFNPGESLSHVFELFEPSSSSSSSSRSLSSSSNSSGSSWSSSTRTTYAQSGHLYRKGNGEPYSIGLDDGTEIYVYGELSDGRLQDQNGDLWMVLGNDVLRV